MTMPRAIIRVQLGLECIGESIGHNSNYTIIIIIVEFFYSDIITEYCRHGLFSACAYKSEQYGIYRKVCAYMRVVYSTAHLLRLTSTQCMTHCPHHLRTLYTSWKKNQKTENSRNAGSLGRADSKTSHNPQGCIPPLMFR